MRARAPSAGVGPALAALSLLTGGVAQALPAPRAHLIYVRDAAAERCPEEEAVRRSVAARLGYDPFALQAPRTVTVALRARGPGLVAHIELSDELGEVSGRQQLTSPRRRCDDLAPALALAVALAIDPLGASRPEGAPPPDDRGIEAMIEAAPPPPPPPREPPAPPSPPPPRAVAPPREPTRVRLGVGAQLALGVAPTVTGGLALSVGLRESAWSVSLELRGDVPSTGDFGGGRITTTVLAGALVPCIHIPLARRRFELLPCGVLLAGVQLGQGQGYAQDLAVADPIVLAGVRAGFEVPLRGRLSLLAHGDLLAAVLSPRLKVGPDVAWKINTVAGVVGVALLVAVR